MADPSKTEQRALNALENIIDKHPTMSYKFSYLDKDFSWDGDIRLYRDNNKLLTKANFEAKVPVQIKGHVDSKRKYLGNRRIKYKVDLADLHVFDHDRGVLYFQIFISENTNATEVFYASLFPTKVKYYLKKAKMRGNTKQIDVRFNRIQDDENELNSIVRQFSMESLEQGSGLSSSVEHAYSIEDYELAKNKAIQFTVTGVKSTVDVMKRFIDGDVSFYVLQERGNRIPVEWAMIQNMAMTTSLDNTISINGKEYYDSYKVVTMSSGEKLIQLSDNLSFDFVEERYRLNFNSDLHSISRDAEFIFDLSKTKKIEIANNTIEIKELTMPEKLVENLNHIIELDNVLSEVGMHYKKPFKQIEDNTFKQFTTLVNIKKGTYNNRLDSIVQIYNWKIEDLYWPIIIIKKEGEKGVELSSALYSDKHALFAKKDEPDSRIPLACGVEKDVIVALYDYDYDYLIKQVESIKVCDDNAEYMNNLALNYIYVFDEKQNDQIIEIAEIIIDALLEFQPENKIYEINRYQINKRTIGLCVDEKTKIKSLIGENNSIDFGCYVLLDDYNKAESCLSQMPEKELEGITNYPIYTLYKEMEQGNGKNA
ncbi:hypothetical protein KO465_02145 [Candidatus Micrarchaeota archaeon]|jgi:hypothetical protein|nr:hypothetical protein [Candidatus Micrarchaeota archaeon]